MILVVDDKLYEEPLRERIHAAVKNLIDEKQQLLGVEMMHKLEKDVMLQVLDAKWKEHLAAMDYLRQSIGLRGYAQKNPKQEYKREAFEMFQQMLEEIKQDTIAFLCHVKFQSPEEVTPLVSTKEPEPSKLQMQHEQAADILHPGELETSEQSNQSERATASAPKPDQVIRGDKKVGRNAPCPCGSGKKYKHCCGKLS